MQLAKNRIKVLSALSVAAASTFIVRSASAASLSLYYGNSPSQNDAIWVGSGPPTASSAVGNLPSAGSPVSIVPNASGPTTIVVPQGEYLSIAINALLTSNPNSDTGKKEKGTAGSTSQTQPANMGLATLGIKIPSTDAGGTILTPVNNGAAFTTYSGVPGYNSWASINQTTTAQGGSVVPKWSGSTSPGDVETGSNTPAQTNGSVGLNSQIFGGNTSIPINATGMSELRQFSASSATYTNSTEFFQGLLYKGSSPGTVTLAPFADTAATQYWSVLTPASSSNSKGIYQSGTDYQATYFGSNDTVGTLPVLVIDVTATAPTSHAIVSLTSATPTAYGTSSGTLTVHGGSGKYSFAQITGLSDVTNYVTSTGWAPTTDEEIYGLDVQVNNVQATAAQIATLVNAINGDGTAPASVTGSPGLTASGTIAAPDPFPSNYNLFLTFATGSNELEAPIDLGVDLSQSNDSNLVGYSFTAVAAVPEPMSLGLLAAGGIGLMARRSRRKA